MQPLQRLQGDQRQLDVVVRGQPVDVDDVDVGLGELPVAALLRPLTPPDLLDLVAAEREGQRRGRARARSGPSGTVRSKCRPSSAARPRLGVQPGDRVHLLVDLALLGQPLQRLDRPGLDGGEPVQLEGLPQPVQHRLLDNPPLRRQLGEAGQRADPAHRSAPRPAGAGTGWSPARRPWSSAGRARAAPPPGRAAAAPWSAGSPAWPRGRRRAGRFVRSSRRTGRRRRRPRGSVVRRPWRYIVEPGVCPGACAATKSIPATDDRGPVGQLPNLVRLDEAGVAGDQLGEQRPGLGPHRPQRVGQQSPVRRVDPARRLVGPAERGDGEHVVEMAVGQHHRHRLEPVLGDQLRDAGLGIQTRIDDHALGSRAVATT